MYVRTHKDEFIALGHINMLLQLGISYNTDLHGKANFLHHRGAMELSELFRCVLASHLDKHLFATRVLVNKVGNIKHLAVDNNPNIISLVMLSNLFTGVGLHFGYQELGGMEEKDNAVKEERKGVAAAIRPPRQIPPGQFQSQIVYTHVANA